MARGRSEPTLPSSSAPQVAFSEFVKQVQKNEVQRVVIDSTSNSFTFSLRPSSPLYKMLPGGPPNAAPSGWQRAGVCSTEQRIMASARMCMLGERQRWRARAA